ncbi:MAG: hypothetical protein JOZ83_04270 [Silvibacterium sp.]|nr:hypothetical protein [Silvibacterium sp.]
MSRLPQGAVEALLIALACLVIVIVFHGHLFGRVPDCIDIANSVTMAGRCS